MPSKTRTKVMTGDKYAIKSMWEEGEHTVDDIAETLNLKRDTVYSIIRRNGWEKGVLKKRIEESLMSRLEQEEQEELSEEERIKKDRMEKWDMQQNAALQMLVNSQLRILKKNQGEKATSLALMGDDVKALQGLALSFRTIQDIASKIFGEDQSEDDDLPDLLVGEMSEDDIGQIRRQQELQYRESRGEVVDGEVESIDEGDD